jgi:fatty acid desaturase
MSRRPPPPLPSGSADAASLRARWASDWREGLLTPDAPRAHAAGVFAFFAQAAPAITFAGLLSQRTGGACGVAETLLGMGAHPMAGHFVAEHYTFDKAPSKLGGGAPQETFSYYGPLNVVALNVGYHNEHHDLPGVPWHRLPKVRAAAPETYDTLVWYRSWTGLVVRYLTDPTLGPWKRVVRPSTPVDAVG